MRVARLIAAILPLAFVACLGGSESTQPTPIVPIESTTFAPSLNVNLAASTKTASGLYYRDIIVGGGATFMSGRSVGVFYAGSLASGSQFDARQAPLTPFPFTLGAGQVIRGWDEGLVGMKIGGKRQLIIPPALGYGATGSGPIPPNAVLVFTVDAVSTQ